jgi:hypothetical protein
MGDIDDLEMMLGPMDEDLPHDPLVEHKGKPPHPATPWEARGEAEGKGGSTVQCIHLELLTSGEYVLLDWCESVGVLGN